MSYSNLGKVKNVLGITEETWDTEISECIESADAIIDAVLKAKGLTVPSPTPRLIADASAHFAAWLFRRRRDPAGAKVFYEEAQELLNTYIMSETTYVGRA